MLTDSPAKVRGCLIVKVRLDSGVVTCVAGVHVVRTTVEKNSVSSLREGGFASTTTTTDTTVGDIWDNDMRRGRRAGTGLGFGMEVILGGMGLVR